MFLKRLTMKGFKSFADPTTLEFEPGVTAVVGPNGSGKSNVVDAVTWVLGAQSTRALRSARMEDVIFAGTTTRAALGRAEVSLTLDNGSGRLGVDGAEVTISRTLFRNGESEYAINGAVCRLLDVQELLADSGVGRQQHMIIGQGQLDSVLNSRPEDRRAVIEEAAGVLKHRRRKERAERRLEATHENLERLGDLVREIRRQMRPLERQASAAQSYASVEGELRAAQRFQLAERLREFTRRRTELEVRLRLGSASEREIRHELVALDARAAAAAVELSGHREEALASALARLEGLVERARGLGSLIAERQRGGRAALVASADENVVATLEADSAALSAELRALEPAAADLEGVRADLAVARETLAEAEAQFDATWGAEALGRARAELAGATARRELILEALAASRTAFEAASARDGALAARVAALAHDGEALLAGGAEEERVARDAAADAVSADSVVTGADRARDDAAEALRAAGDRAHAATARSEALARAFAELSGARAGELVTEVRGVLGPLLELIDVDEGLGGALHAAAGAAGSGVVVDSLDAARGAIDRLRHAGGAGVVLPARAPATSAPPPAAGCRALREVVRPRAGADARVGAVLDALFADVSLAPSFEAALDVASQMPERTVVTADGDRFGPGAWRIASGQSLVTASAVAQAEEEATAARDTEALARVAHAAAVTASDDARAALEAARLRAVRAEAARARTVESAARATAEGDSLRAERATLGAERAAAESRVAELEDARVAVEAEIALLESAVAESAERDRWAAEARETVNAHRRQVAEGEADLLRQDAFLAERRRLLTARLADVEARLADHDTERAAAASRRERFEGDLRALAALLVVVERATSELQATQATLADSYRSQLAASRHGADQLDELRRRRTVLEGSLGDLGEATRRDEIEYAELAVKIDNVAELVRRELGEEPDQITDAAPPDLAPGVTVEQRVGELVARIGALGPINPLALEELDALRERHRELEEQVADVRHARRELLEVVRTLDQEIMDTFSAAVADVNEHFSSLIAMLFPGGQGRLILTVPEDPLNTGVEIEVRPLGRNVRRISLLSGGERSMAALAFLFAVFRSRPSPFYLMDEVEAALDDVNLQRFLSLIDEFRDEAQLLIVTHQKRSMEAADALYGVTMAPGGSSRVVSQRVPREVVPVS